MQQEEYTSISAAAKKYGVSRAKVHRLIQQGKVGTAEDPRDARVTLVWDGDVRKALGAGGAYAPRAAGAAEVRDGGALAMAERYTAGTGTLTAEQRRRVDALRARLARGSLSGEDSVDVIRRMREERTRALEGREASQ
jgi:hypothetical protein